MKEHIYKYINIIGSSEVGSDQAIRNAVSKASETIRNMDWFEVVGVQGDIHNGAVHHWQATIKIGFRLED